MESLKGEKCNILWGGLPYRPLDVMHAVAPLGLNPKAIHWLPKVTLLQGLRRLLESK